MEKQSRRSGGNSTQPVTISNVANGTKPNDAVNVSQLTSSTNYAIDQSKQYTDQQIHNINTGIQNDMWQLDRIDPDELLAVLRRWVKPGLH